MDDLLIFSKDEKDQFKRLEIVLCYLKEHELYVSPKKCEFMKEEINFLGSLVGKKRLRVNPDKIKVLQKWPKPETLTDVRSFMGLLQFFWRFIPKFFEVAAPLTDLTKKGVSIDKWNRDCDSDFAKLKDAITQAPILVAFDWKKPSRGHVDASRLAVGGTLTQLDDDVSDRVIAFFSKMLSPTEADYTANDRELNGLISFPERFRCYLGGTSFEILTDNQVFKHFFTKPKMSRKKARWLETLEDFGIFPITLKPGNTHVLGDVLSRAPHILKGSSSVLSFNDGEVLGAGFEYFIPRYNEDRSSDPSSKP